MKKLRLIKQNQIAISREQSIACDFCGDEDKEVFTSSYADHIDQSRNESQICLHCIIQLHKLI